MRRRFLLLVLLSLAAWAGVPELYGSARDVVLCEVKEVHPKYVDLVVKQVLRGQCKVGWKLDLAWRATPPTAGSRWILNVRLAPPNGPVGTPSWVDEPRCRLPGNDANRQQVADWLKRKAAP